MAIEATYGSYRAVDVLRSTRFEAHRFHPYGVKAMRAPAGETDQRDAHEQANLLRLCSLLEA